MLNASNTCLTFLMLTWCFKCSLEAWNSCLIKLIKLMLQMLAWHFKCLMLQMLSSRNKLEWVLHNYMTSLYLALTFGWAVLPSVRQSVALWSEMGSFWDKSHIHPSLFFSTGWACPLPFYILRVAIPAPACWLVWLPYGCQ